MQKKNKTLFIFDIDNTIVDTANIWGKSLDPALDALAKSRKIERKQIIVDKTQKTNVKGVFAAGDITDNPLKQIITACGEGAIATNSVYKELLKER